MTANWYEDVAAAIRERDKALAAIGRWEDKLVEAENVIAGLAQRADAPKATPVAIAEAAPEIPVVGPEPDFAELPEAARV